MDSDYYEAVKNEGIYAYLGQPESWVSGPEADYYKTTPENAEAHLQQAIDEGWALKADTVAELAEKFSLDALEATVERYNGFCDAGEDGDFGKSAPFLKPVRTAPFYLFEYVPSAWGTNGGVKVDSHLRAMDAEQQPHPRPVRGRRRPGQRLLRAVLHEPWRVGGPGLGFRRVRGQPDPRRVRRRTALPSGPAEWTYRAALSSGRTERPY